MIRDHNVSRRVTLGRAGCSAGAVLLAAAASGKTEESAKDQGEKRDQIEVTPPEDLMREHGVLYRLLLVYEKAISAGNRPAAWPTAQFADAVQLVRSFVEDYHEKLEEDYIFPRFEKAGRLTDLVAVLRKQHDAGRQVTDAVLRQVQQTGSAPNTQTLAASLAAYIRMYRPHAARESTVLFPQIAAIVPPAQYAEMGDKFEEIEHEKFGPPGFEGVVQKVAEIEKTLGIHDLASFTPKVT